jgi:hypothetical protein
MRRALAAAKAAREAAAAADPIEMTPVASAAPPSQARAAAQAPQPARSSAAGVQLHGHVLQQPTQAPGQAQLPNQAPAQGLSAAELLRLRAEWTQPSPASRAFSAALAASLPSSLPPAQQPPLQMPALPALRRIPLQLHPSRAAQPAAPHQPRQQSMPAGGGMQPAMHTVQQPTAVQMPQPAFSCAPAAAAAQQAPWQGLQHWQVPPAVPLTPAAQQAAAMPGFVPPLAGPAVPWPAVSPLQQQAQVQPQGVFMGMQAAAPVLWPTQNVFGPYVHSMLLSVPVSPVPGVPGCPQQQPAVPAWPYMPQQQSPL